MNGLIPLQLIFVTLTDKKGNPIGTHVAFYDLFGGIPEVLPSENDGQPELIISPINKYIACLHEVITLWITMDQKEKVGKAIQETFNKRDPMMMIFSGNLVDENYTALTDTSFCVEALRTALPILPNVPINCITTPKLYTALKIMGGM